MYELENVSFSVGSKAILKDISISIETKKITTLLGHNGCGKSTLIKLLARQLQASEGSIHLNNTKLSAIKQSALARQVAYLPQHPPMTDGVTVKELVYFGRYPCRSLLSKNTQQDAEIVDDAIKKVDMQGLSNQFVATLSGGERQRAWVAMLLAQQTDILLLDEPISSLDIAHQFELIQLIHDLNEQLNLTVIMVLHDINLASRFSDQIVALHSGEVIFKGSPNELLTHDTLKKIYGMDLGIVKHPGSERLTTYIP